MFWTKFTLVHQDILSCWKSLREWWATMTICLSFTKSKGLIIEALSFNYLSEHELYSWIFVCTLHSFINEACIDLIKWKGNWGRYIFIQFEFAKTKTLNFVHVRNCIVLELFFVETDSSDIEERGIVWERDPESPIIFINIIDLRFCMSRPFLWFITPIARPFFFAPRITNL